VTETQAPGPGRRPTLSSILEATRARVARLGPRRRELERAAARAAPIPSWSGALRGSDLAVIAEVKRRSPSAGDIAPDLDPATHARGYAAGGARALSVLTDAAHFGGSLDDLRAVREAVELPVLRKDFIIDPVQLFEARAAGASAVLLIVRAVPDETLSELAALARELGLACLVEVHAAAELSRAVAVRPDCIGVNARDLDTFAVDRDAARAVLRQVPASILAVAESGITTRQDVTRVATDGADAILVGTALAGAPDPAAAVRRLVGVPRRRGARRESR